MIKTVYQEVRNPSESQVVRGAGPTSQRGPSRSETTVQESDPVADSTFSTLFPLGLLIVGHKVKRQVSLALEDA